LLLQDGYTGDLRTLEKLVDGTNVTTDDLHMWLLPFTPGGSHKLHIDLGKTRHVYGVCALTRHVCLPWTVACERLIMSCCRCRVAAWQLRFWNYNKTPEDAQRGVRALRISLDAAVVHAHVGDRHRSLHVLRPAPGHALFDFRQDLVFSLSASVPVARSVQGTSGSGAKVLVLPEFPLMKTVRRDATAAAAAATGGLTTYVPPAVRQDYETPLLPCGQLFKVTWRRGSQRL
jgi:hypothetical protein